MNDNPDGEKIISLAAVKAAREAPDPEFVRKDDKGRDLFKFTADYHYPSELFLGEAGTYSISFWAYSFADAEAKVAAMRASLELKGQLYGKV